MFFKYGDKELSYLKKKDKKLSVVIDEFSFIQRELDSSLFLSVIHHIVGQQISNKAKDTILKRLYAYLGEINIDTILNTEDIKLKECGLSERKILYIKDFTHKVKYNLFNLDAIQNMSDEDAIKELISLKGIGVWTAQMILIFALNRLDIFSYDDLAIKRGLSLIYHHKEITKEVFLKYKKRFSPYGSVASFYIWAVANKESSLNLKKDKRKK